MPRKPDSRLRAKSSNISILVLSERIKFLSVVTYFYWSIGFRIGNADIVEIRFLMGIDRVEILVDGVGRRCALYFGDRFGLGASV